MRLDNALRELRAMEEERETIRRDLANNPTPRYRYADANECGILYRPGELSMPDLNYCRLRVGHGGNFHSTRMHRYDASGYEWRMRSTGPEVDFSFPPAVRVDDEPRQD